MTESITESLLKLQLDDLEMSLLRAQQHFRKVMAHVRCAICAEYIDDQRWHLGELHGEQEVFHTECYDAEEAAWSEDYESRAQGIAEHLEEVNETFAQVHDTPDNNGSGSGQPEGEAEAGSRADDVGSTGAEEDAAAEGLGADAGKHGDVRHQPDAEGQRPSYYVAGYRGPDDICIPNRVISTGDEPITARVPFTLKAQLRELVRKKPIDYSPKKVHTGLILRGLKAAGEI